MNLPVLRTAGRYLLEFDPQLNCTPLRVIHERSTTIRDLIPWLRDRDGMTFEQKLEDHATPGEIRYWDRVVYFGNNAVAVVSAITGVTGDAYLSWWVCASAKSQAINVAILSATVAELRDNKIKTVFVDPKQESNSRRREALRLCGFEQAGPEHQFRRNL